MSNHFNSLHRRHGNAELLARCLWANGSKLYIRPGHRADLAGISRAGLAEKLGLDWRTLEHAISDLHRLGKIDVRTPGDYEVIQARLAAPARESGIAAYANRTLRRWWDYLFVRAGRRMRS